MDQKGYSTCGWCGEFLAILAPVPTDVRIDNFDLCNDCGQYPKRREILREYQQELKMRNFWESMRLGYNSSTGRVLYGGNYILGRSGKLVVALVLQMPSDPTL